MSRAIELPPATAASAIERAYREHGDAIWRSVLVATGGHADIADDATAEAFALAIRSEESIRNPVAWVHRVALRIAAAEVRRRRRLAPEDEPAATPPAELSDQLTRALAQLSMQQRTAVFLHYQADLSVAEIAERMGTSAATVRVHLHRGRRRLKQFLEVDRDE
jgi:RNA polymerase sigma-70 factor, ECF subfamily